MANLPDPTLDACLAGLFRRFVGDALSGGPVALSGGPVPAFSAAVLAPGGVQLAGCSNAPLLDEVAGCIARHLHDRHPVDGWRPGDLFVSNSPFLGGVSPRVVSVLSPIPLADEPGGLVAFSVCHADVGAMAEGAFAMRREARHEGFVLSLLRVGLVDGRLPPLLLSMFAANVRRPQDSTRWLHAQVGATTAAAAATAQQAVGGPGLSARAAAKPPIARQALAALTPGTYRGHAAVGHASSVDGDARVSAEVVVRPDGIRIRPSLQAADTRPADLHATAAATRAGAIAAVAIAAGRPGWLLREAIELEAQDEPVFDAAYPAAVGRADRVALAVHAATCDALRGAAAHAAIPLSDETFTGVAR